jgi:hypothetical protein
MARRTAARRGPHVYSPDPDGITNWRREVLCSVCNQEPAHSLHRLPDAPPEQRAHEGRYERGEAAA